jgi:hypothetical protein
VWLLPIPDIIDIILTVEKYVSFEDDIHADCTIHEDNGQL